MFHTFVGYLYGRIHAENEEGKKKPSNVLNKMQGLVSMMIMKKKQDLVNINGREKVKGLLKYVSGFEKKASINPCNSDRKAIF